MEEIDGSPQKHADMICATIWNVGMMLLQTQLAEGVEIPRQLANVKPVSFSNGVMEEFFNAMAKGPKKMTGKEMEEQARREQEQWRQR